MDAKKILIGKIAEFQRKYLIFRLLAGAANLLIYLCLIWISSFLADSAIYFSETARWFVLIFNGLVTLYLMYRLLLTPLVLRLKLSDKTDFTKVTEIIGRFYPEIRDRIKNNYQLATRAYSGSSAIGALAVERFTASLEKTDLSERIKLKGFLVPPWIYISVLAGSIFLVTILNEPIYRSFKRIMNPTGNYAVVPPYSFHVEPGDRTIISGTRIEIRAQYSGPLADRGFLFFKKQGESEYRYKLLQAAGNEWVTDLENIVSDIEYYIQLIPVHSAEWRDQIISEQFHIRTRIPPVVNELQVEISPPPYTGLNARFLDNNVGDFLAYPGTRVKVSLHLNKPVVSAELEFSNGKIQTGEVRDVKVNYSFTVDNNTTYRFVLKDKEGIINQNPISYNITVIPDQFPVVEITDPGEDVEVAADGALNLVAEAKDDFGFSLIRLHYQINSPLEEARDSAWYHIPLPLPPTGTKYVQQTYFWNFTTLAVGFDEMIRYYISVTDNDKVHGPKLSRSNIYMVRFPSIDQLFEEFSAGQDEQIRETEDLADESEALKKELEKINREMKKEQQVDWERKRSLEAAIEKQKQIQEKLEQIGKDIEQAINKLEKNNLFSPEILEKYKELQDLFQEIATPELLAAMQEIQKTMEKMDQNQVKAAVEKFKIDQERFKENLERTLELFKKVQLEQEMDRLVHLARDMEKEQQRLSDEIEKTPGNQADSEKLQRQADNQSERMDKFNNALKNLEQDQLIGDMPAVKEKLMEATQTGDQSARDMDEISKQLSENNRQSAGQKSSQVSQQLKKIHAALQSAQQQMQQQDREKIMMAMNKISANLLQLSQTQEELIGQSNELSDFSDRFPAVAGSQQENLENLSRVTHDVIELSQQTFFLNPGLNKSLGAAHGGMRNGLKELENRNNRAAVNHQKQAMGGLNESVMFMQASMEEMANSQSALGFEQYLKQMQQLSNQQGQLNEESINFMKGNQGSLSAEQQGQLQRMAGEQAAIKKSMEEMASGMQKRGDLLGDLDQMVGEMEQVIKEMQGMQMDRKTIERQQKILSRMLDAQKSVREKEYSKQRLAETGKEYQRRQPPPLNEQENAKLKLLKRELIRALQEGYNPDYEQLIEKYFKNLNETISE